MRRSVALALAVAAAALTASPATAAPGDCVAVSPVRPSCSVQSAGGAFEVSCVVADYCRATIDGFWEDLASGESTNGWVPYGTVIGVTVYGSGVAVVTTS